MKFRKFLKNKELSLILEDKRLKMILIYTVCSSFVLWYGIEKVFLKDYLNLSISQIASLPLIYMISGLIFELPSSVLADRWSRNKTLALSLVFLMSASVAGGLSRGYLDYVLAASLWSLASSFYSGTNDALLYDSLLDIKKEDYYLKINVLLKRIFSLSIFVATSVGSLLLTEFSPRLIYFLPVPVFLVGTIAILSIKEPSHHKINQESNTYKHIKKTFKAIASDRILLARLLVASLLIHIAVSYLYEFMPLSFLQLGTKESLVGVLTSIATVLSYIILAGYVSRFKNIFWQPILITIGLLMLLLGFEVRSIPVFILVIITAMMSYQYATDMNNAMLQSRISSGERSSISSTMRLIAAALTVVIFYPLLNFSMNKFGDSGYLLVSAFVGFIALALSLYVYHKQKDEI
jgi:MFS family permease